jgi:hypothetical protein
VFLNCKSTVADGLFEPHGCARYTWRVKIGLPDTLRYHRYGPWWEQFLVGIGVEVLKPQLGLTEALHEGAQLMPEEPPTIQLFLGRVLELAPDVDALIVPDLNPGAEPGDRAGTADPWAVDLGTVLGRRFSLPPIHSIPARLDPTETSTLALRLGLVLAQNAQIVRRVLDRTQSGLRPTRQQEPVWQRAGRRTVGVIGDPTLLEQPFLWQDARTTLERHNLHVILASDLPRERNLDVGRQRHPSLSLETDLEVAGAAVILEGKAQVRGLVALVQPHASIQAQLASELVRKAHKPAVLLESGSDLNAALTVFAPRV